MTGRRIVFALLLSVAAVLTGCSGGTTDPDVDHERAILTEGGKLFGDITFGGNEERSNYDTTTGIGVNGYLWRASLDTLSFLPLTSADPFGGVIITDWYAPPESPDERFKVTVYLLGRQLRSDGLRVAVFRQSRAGTTGWADAALSDDTATRLTDAILNRARELRIASNTG
jgi:hypothetical protein